MRNEKGQFVKGYTNGFESNLELGRAWNKGLHVSTGGGVKKGNIPWNKGKKGSQLAWNKGKTCIQFSKENHPNWKGGEIVKRCNMCLKEFSVEAYRKNTSKYCSKECYWNDNLGLSKQDKLIRNSAQYKQWRTSVFERDNFTCQLCNERGGVLNADHIKRFADYPDLRFNVDNGRTLCIECHKTTGTYGNRKQTIET